MQKKLAIQNKIESNTGEVRGVKITRRIPLLKKGLNAKRDLEFVDFDFHKLQDSLKLQNLTRS